MDRGLKLVGLLCLVQLLMLQRNGVQAHPFGGTKFCGRENCYKVLGVTREAEPKVIQKAYRKLSLEVHPDVNPSPKAAKAFQRLANAYEIVGNEEKREEYDHYLDHPEEWGFAEYAAHSNLGVVIFGILAITTTLHYLNMRITYNSKLKKVQSSEYYKERVVEMVQNGDAETVEDAESKISIEGLKKPQFMDLLPVVLVKMPFVISKEVYKLIRWHIRYDIQKKEFTEEDRIIMLRRNLNLSERSWEEIPEKTKEEFIEKKLWEEEAFQDYLYEQKIEMNRRGKTTRKRINKQKRKALFDEDLYM